MSAIIISEAFIVTMCDGDTAQPQRGWVGIVDNRIAEVSYDLSKVEVFKRNHPDAEEINCRGKVVMPGLINTHTHISMTLMRNYADDKEINEWLNKYIWPFESFQTNEDIEAGARLGVAESLLGGTTTIVDMYMTCQNIAKVAKEMGIRAQVGEVLFDISDFDRSMSNVDAALNIADECSRITVGVDSHAPYTCGPQTLERVRSKREECGFPMAIHILEGVSERQLIEDRYGVAPVQYLDQHGVLDS